MARRKRKSGNVVPFPAHLARESCFAKIKRPEANIAEIFKRVRGGEEDDRRDVPRRHPVIFGNGRKWPDHPHLPVNDR